MHLVCFRATAGLKVPEAAAPEWFVTELSRVKHYVLGAVMKGSGWAFNFGTYICKEQHPECKLPYLAEDSNEMEKNNYFQYNDGS